MVAPFRVIWMAWRVVISVPAVSMTRSQPRPSVRASTGLDGVLIPAVDDPVRPQF